MPSIFSYGVAAALALAGGASANSEHAIAVRADNVARVPNEIIWEDKCNARFGRDARFKNTPFGKHACAVKNQKAPKVIDTGAYPRAYKPPFGKKVQGAILLFHGYTASPNSMRHIANELADEGFYVYSPLTVGHGRLRNSGCDDPETDCVQGYPVDDLPTDIFGYTSWTESMVDMFQQECETELKLTFANAKFGVMGLSLGGAFTTYALAYKPDFWDKGLLVDAFLGITLPAQDRTYQSCVGKEATNENLLICVGGLIDMALGRQGVFSTILRDQFARHALAWLVDLLGPSDSPAYWVRRTWQGMNNAFRLLLSALVTRPQLVQNFDLQSLMEGEHLWGPNCELQYDWGRKGFCAFRRKHLFSIHAFAQHALSMSGAIGAPQVNAIVTERDGFQRNALSASVLLSANQTFPNTKIDMCVWPMEKGAEPCVGNSNTCGVPHSLFSKVELGPDQEMYWEDNLYRYVKDFFSHGTPVGDFVGVPNYDHIETSEGYDPTQEHHYLDGKKDVCGRVHNPLEPDEAYFGSQSRRNALIRFVFASGFNDAIDGRVISSSLLASIGFDTSRALDILDTNLDLSFFGQLIAGRTGMQPRAAMSKAGQSVNIQYEMASDVMAKLQTTLESGPIILNDGMVKVVSADPSTKALRVPSSQPTAAEAIQEEEICEEINIELNFAPSLIGVSTLVLALAQMFIVIM